MQAQVTVFKSINSHVPQYYNVTEVLDRIKRGVNKNLIDQIRNEPNKEKRNTLKKSLLWICFSGKFKTRHNDDLLKHSGLMCLDFDNFPNTQTLFTWKGKLKSDIHTYTVFVSPSGNGLKVLFRVPECQTNEEHNLRFDAITEYWKHCIYFDKNVKGVSRVCYESYDNNLFINEYSEVFTEIAELKPEFKNEVTESTLLDDLPDTFKKLLVWFESKYNLSKGNRNTNLLYLFSACRDYGISESDAMIYVSNYASIYAEDFNSINGELNRISKSAYSKPSANKKMVKLVTDSIALEEDNSIETDNFFFEDELEYEQDKSFELPELVEFWKWNNSGFKIDFLELKKFLQDHGFYRYELNEKDFIFIRVKENTIQEVDVRHIKDFLLRCLESWDKPDIYNMIAENTKFKKEYLNYLDPFEVNWNKDTKDVGWIYFNNIAVKVTKEKIELVKYIDLDGFIWKTKKLNRNFSLLEKYDCFGCDFARFVENICKKDEDRIKSFKSGVGYLLHSFKSKSTVKAVIFNDEILSEDAMGGTGKGLTMQIIGTQKNIVIIPGADFNTGKDFAWQRINFDTDIVLIDDIEKSFKYKKLFTFLTDGWPIRKLYQDELFMAPEDSPKIAINTNFTLKGDTDSYARRKFELELFPHYSKSYQPIDDFGREFISEWPEDEKNRCDNYLLYCLKDFLNNGLIEPEYVNLQAKKLIINTSEDFISFAEFKLHNDTKYNKKDLYLSFKNDHGIGLNEYPNQKIFTLWMEFWGKHNGWTCNSRAGGGGTCFTYGTGETEWKEDNELIF